MNTEATQYLEGVTPKAKVAENPVQTRGKTEFENTPYDIGLSVKLCGYFYGYGNIAVKHLFKSI
jgi:hypothetical protein